MIIRLGRTKLALVTALPAFVLIPIVMSAGYYNAENNYLPKGLYLDVVLSIVLIVRMTIVFIEAFCRWYALTRVTTQVRDHYGELVLANVED